MDDIRTGLQVRAVRLRCNLTQAELAARIGLSRETVSRLERGDLEGLTVRSLRLIGPALGMPPVVSLGWRGADVAQLLDSGHASLVEGVVRILRSRGWGTLLEYSFSRYGERGSVDVVAWHAETQTLLLIEVKTRIVDLQDLFYGLDRKRRLVPPLLEGERGWKPRAVGVALVLPCTATSRRAVARHAASFDSVLPARGIEVRRWVGSPEGDLRGVWFVADSRAV